MLILYSGHLQLLGMATLLNEISDNFDIISRILKGMISKILLPT